MAKIEDTVQRENNGFDEKQYSTTAFLHPQLQAIYLVINTASLSNYLFSI